MHCFWSNFFLVISFGCQWMLLEYCSKQVKNNNPCILKSEMPTYVGISLFKMPTYDGKTQHALMMGPIFFFFGVGNGDFCVCVCVWLFSPIPNMFLASSLEVPQVPKLFPKAFPIAPQFYHMICPKFNPHVYKLKSSAIGEYICLNFAIGSPKRCFHWGSD
jgi:hypothetical protein